MDRFDYICSDPKSIFCIRNNNGEVIFQNANSIENCCKDATLQCHLRCLPYIESSFKFKEIKSGLHLFKNKIIEKKEYDILVFKGDINTLILLYPIKDQIDDIKMRWKKSGLSPREIEVLTEKFLGAKNSEIAKKLYISKSTVKTHINNIFKKFNGRPEWLNE